MKSVKFLLFVFVVISVYGFIFNHQVEDNRSSYTFSELLNKRVFKSNLSGYMAFTDWIKKIESENTTGNNDNAIDETWFSKVIENIKKEEYNISYNEDCFAYQSPNRANNHRFIYYKDGFSVSPMMTKIPLFDESDMEIKEKDKKYKIVKDWKITMRLHSFGKNEILKTFNGDKLTADKNTAFIEDNNLKIKYENNEEGMRQDFIIKQKPEGEGFLKLRMDIRTKSEVIIGANGVSFKENSSKEVLKYNGLKAWDSEGKELKGWFEKTNSKSFHIVINDEKAVYPITIDPLSTASNWSAFGNRGQARFGCSVSSAGDVNNDGYSDVIIGAWDYWSGVNYSAAFVFHGSATGLSTIADWSTFGSVAGNRLGYSVSSAGDVNGDGYSDVIIGVPSYSNGENYEGAALVFHGNGTSSGLSSTADWVVESNQAGADFGRSVSSAGDVNGDGYSDVIVGADLYDNGLNAEGMAFVYHGSGSGLPSTANWTFESDQYQARFGYSVSNAGDINGDGYSDIIVGAYACNFNGNNAGRAYLFIGSSLGLSATADWIKEGSAASTYFGNSVSTAGDVNGDGYSDVIVGAEGFENGQYNEGKAYVYHGSLNGLSDTANWSFESNQAYANFGSSVSIAGDVNGDGFSDVIVGAQYYDNGENDEGRAFVYFGSSSGLSPAPNWLAESNQAGAFYGNSVSTAGDVNGDGFSDVIVGAANYDNSYINEGGAFVYHGFAGGVYSTIIWTKMGDLEDAHFGCSVSTAGDVNGDGYSDVIIGARSYENSEYREGRIYVFHGSANGLSTSADWHAAGIGNITLFGCSVSSAGDVNGDGYSDVIIGARAFGTWTSGKAYVYLGSSSGLSETADWNEEGDQNDWAYFGWSVSTAGDVNGDGYSDVIVGAVEFGPPTPYDNINGLDSRSVLEGKAYVYHGSPTGLSETYNWSAGGGQDSTQFGRSVSTAGDVNGDGFSDVIVGAPFYDNGQKNEGRAFVYYGSQTGLSTTADWTAEGEEIGAFLGWSVSTAGDVNGDGYSDVIAGAIGYGDGGGALVYHGSSSGLSSTANWIVQSEQYSTYFGKSVSTAGDVNGDGYSDVIIGHPEYIISSLRVGKIYVYHGSSIGLSSTANWTKEGVQTYGFYGDNVSTAGDVNGDGYSEVIVGTEDYEFEGEEVGIVELFYGNNYQCMQVKPRQWRSDMTTPVIPPLKSRSSNSLGVGLFLNTFFGRSKIKMQIEVQPLGTPFGSGDGAGITESGWYDIGTAGTEISTLITGLYDKTMYKWRMRFKYYPVHAPPQQYSRWFYNVTSPNGPMVSSIQVSNDDNPLPVSFLSFTSQVEKNDVILKWSTLNEINNRGYGIQRKISDNKQANWVEVGFVKGNGTTNQISDYQFTNKNMQKGRYLYRLKQVDINNNFEYHFLGSPVSIGVPVKFVLDQNYPNSFNPTTKIDFALPIDGRVSLKVYDITGRLIKTLINNEYRTADYYTVEFNGSNFASGVYFYQLITEKNIATKKMVLIK